MDPLLVILSLWVLTEIFKVPGISCCLNFSLLKLTKKVKQSLMLVRSFSNVISEFVAFLRIVTLPLQILFDVQPYRNSTSAPYFLFCLDLL